MYAVCSAGSSQAGRGAQFSERGFEIVLVRVRARLAWGRKEASNPHLGPDTRALWALSLNTVRILALHGVGLKGQLASKTAKYTAQWDQI